MEAQSCQPELCVSEGLERAQGPWALQAVTVGPSHSSLRLRVLSVHQGAQNPGALRSLLTVALVSPVCIPLLTLASDLSLGNQPGQPSVYVVGVGRVI